MANYIENALAYSTSEANQVQDLVAKETDVGGVLIITSYIDSCLERVLRSTLKKGNTLDNLLKSGGALSTFSSRCDLCYVLGLISKEFYNDLKKISEIRNTFAHHHLTANFENEKVKNNCNELKMPDNYLYASNTQSNIIELTQCFKSPKVRFSYTAFSAIDLLVKLKISVMSRPSR
jgi:DNA-binding MltR family transcriptional regulator